MTIAIPSDSADTDLIGIEPTRLVLRPLLNLDENQFFQLCVQNRDQPLELTVQGEVIFVAPHGLLLSSQNAKIAYQLTSWDREEKHGITFGSRTPFRFPNNSVRRPDAAWVERSRWDRLTREQQESIARLCPNFVIELRSKTDRLVDLQEKMVEYLANGVELGWIVDPLQCRVHIYTAGKPVQILNRPGTVAGTGCMTGFVLELKGIFPVTE